MKQTKWGTQAFDWTPENITKLKKLYPKKNNEDIAQALGTSVRSVRSKAQYLKLKKANRFWTATEEKYLLKNYELMTVIELDAHLHRGKWSIINKYRELTGKRN